MKLSLLLLVDVVLLPTHCSKSSVHMHEAIINTEEKGRTYSAKNGHTTVRGTGKAEWVRIDK